MDTVAGCLTVIAMGAISMEVARWVAKRADPKKNKKFLFTNILFVVGLICVIVGSVFISQTSAGPTIRDFVNRWI